MEDKSTTAKQPNNTVVTFKDLSPLTAETQQQQEGRDEEQQQQEDRMTAMVSTTMTEDDKEDEPVEVAMDANEDNLVTNKAKISSTPKESQPIHPRAVPDSPGPDQEGYLKIVCIHCKEY